MTPRIEQLENQIIDLMKELKAERRSAPSEVFQDYALQNAAGETSLRELFGNRDELLVIHNMGQVCEYCTLWAEGFNGMIDQFLSRSAFVVISPDSPAEQAALAKQRGWKFPMAQDATREFTTAAGFWTEADGWWPGASGFRKEGDVIVRTGKTTFFPNDQFCSIWPLMDLIGGPKGWEPSFE